MGERLRHLRQAQLRVGGEAHLQAEERGGDPEADDYPLRAGHVQVLLPQVSCVSRIKLPQVAQRLPRSSAVAQDFEVVAVVHDAQDVAEGVDDRGGDEPGPRSVTP